MATDKSIKCMDCGTTFTFTAREQEFYATKGFSSEPKRCFNCRQAKKLERGESSSRGNYSKNY